MATGKCTHTTLMLVNFEDRFVFTCNGCKELGYGSCYTCHPQCNYHLHKDCHISRPTISHPFFAQGEFVLKQFHNNVPQNLLCDACGMSVRGWRYAMAIDRSSEVSLHPCCMTLPQCNTVNGESFVLTQKLESLNMCCAHCRQSSSGAKGWAYVLARGNLAFHVKCIKEIMHHRNWERNYDYSPNDHLNKKFHQVVNQDRGLNERRIRKHDLILGAANIALFALGLGGTSDIILMMVELATNIWGSI